MAPISIGVTSHIHLIIRSGGEILLQDILRDYKKFTSKAIIHAIEENIQESRKEWLLQQFRTPEGYRFWRGDNKPIELWSNKVIDQKIDYQPVRSGGYPHESSWRRIGLSPRRLCVQQCG